MCENNPTVDRIMRQMRERKEEQQRKEQQEYRDALKAGRKFTVSGRPVQTEQERQDFLDKWMFR